MNKGVLLTANLDVQGSNCYLHDIGHMTKALKLLAKGAEMKVLSEMSSEINEGVGVSLIVSNDCGVGSMHVHTSSVTNRLRLVVDSYQDFDVKLVKALVLSIFNLDIDMVAWDVRTHIQPGQELPSGIQRIA